MRNNLPIPIIKKIACWADGIKYNDLIKFCEVLGFNGARLLLVGEDDCYFNLDFSGAEYEDLIFELYQIDFEFKKHFSE